MLFSTDQEENMYVTDQIGIHITDLVIQNELVLHVQWQLTAHSLIVTHHSLTHSLTHSHTHSLTHSPSSVASVATIVLS